MVWAAWDPFSGEMWAKIILNQPNNPRKHLRCALTVGGVNGINCAYMLAVCCMPWSQFWLAETLAVILKFPTYLWDAFIVTPRWFSMAEQLFESTSPGSWSNTLSATLRCLPYVWSRAGFLYRVYLDICYFFWSVQLASSVDLLLHNAYSIIIRCKADQMHTSLLN